MKLWILLRFVFASMIALCLCACSYRVIMINDVVDMADIALTKFENEYDNIEFLEKAAPGNLVNLEALLANDPENYRMLVLLSKAYFSYTYALLEGKLEGAVFEVDGYKKGKTEIAHLRNEISRNYRKGMDYGLKALEVRHPGCSEKLKKVCFADDFIKSLEKDDVPALFWYGINLTAYINVNKESIKAISRLHIAETIMKRVETLEPEYYYGGAYLNLMTIYSSVPPILGGNPELALKCYKRHKEIAGKNFLHTDLQYARYYLYQNQKREQYIEVLKKIIEHSWNGKEYRMLNIVAKERAKIYLEATDILFE